MLEGKGLIPPDAKTVGMWNEYRALAMSREVREHLGLTADEWANQPAEFVDWATEFWRRGKR